MHGCTVGAIRPPIKARAPLIEGPLWVVTVTDGGGASAGA
jgi:hypothetical protein